MGRWNDVAVYFGLRDEAEQPGRAPRGASPATSVAGLVVRALIGAVAGGAIIGVVRCLLDGEAVTVGRVLEKGWLIAAVVVLAGLVREFRDGRA